MDSKYRFLNNNLVLPSVAAIVLTLFCSYPSWFTYLSNNSLKHFVFVSLPNFKSFVFNPKCLFILCNAIIIFVVGESKFASSRSSLVSEKKEEQWETNRTEESANKVEGGYMVEKEMGEEIASNGDNGDGDGDSYEQDEEEEEEGRDEEGESDLPTEELNKRIEDFIARVNRQRWLEARGDFGRG
ncbi:hypothetical protein RHMOL_Rhmol12G0126800 [Rhododendron molle]|uniref:Uncharacterized protein n=1 Tax=Rhododendron molle TaxID=49168 RepID=A0ACC0LI96_RHOML|nr:hypothetical protein RHMOL_Rhmol12G0126800 [Rhododendron molle]